MKTKSRCANNRVNPKFTKILSKNVKNNAKKQNILHSPETKPILKNKSKINRIVKNTKIKNDELLVVGQGSEQVQLSNNYPMKIVDLNQKIEKRLKILTPCNASGSASKLDKLETNEAKFKILSPHLKSNLNRDAEAKYVAYDVDDKDKIWLDLVNKSYSEKWWDGELTEEMFEWLIDQFERASRFQHHKHQPLIRTLKYKLEIVTNRGERDGGGGDDDAFCCICGDGEGSFCNNILFCELCNIAVHQECYGVPHIPDGSWVCRACHLSPSHQVQCCLCPVRGGALKQTYEVKVGEWEGSAREGWAGSEGSWGEGGLRRWAHITCAAWIPEVLFANNVFLEPVDDIDKIAPARWKLKCVVCLKANVGACIQCHKTGCYTAFHITCAILAGLKMRMEPPSSSAPSSSSSSSSIDLYLKSLSLSSVDSMSFRKVAYCPLHSLPKKTSTSVALARQKERMKLVRGMVRRGEAQLSIRSFPSILQHQLEEIKKDDKYLEMLAKMNNNNSSREAKKTPIKKTTSKKTKKPPKNTESTIKTPEDGGGGLDGGDGGGEGVVDRDVFGVVWRYWLMKRLYNNGVPLISCPQSYTIHPSSQPSSIIFREASSVTEGHKKRPEMKKREVKGHKEDDDEDGDDVGGDGGDDVRMGAFREMKRLRQEFEKVRLLHELIRKREKLKRRELELRRKVTIGLMTSAGRESKEGGEKMVKKKMMTLVKRGRSRVVVERRRRGLRVSDHHHTMDGVEASSSSSPPHDTTVFSSIRTETPTTAASHQFTTIPIPTSPHHPTITIHPTSTIHNVSTNKNTLTNSTITTTFTNPLPPPIHLPHSISHSNLHHNLKLLADTAISHKCNQDSANEASAISTSQSRSTFSTSYEPCDSTTDWLTAEGDNRPPTNENAINTHVIRKRKSECERLKGVEEDDGEVEGGEDGGGVEGVDEGGIGVGSFVWAPWSSNLLYPARLIQLQSSKAAAKQKRASEGGSKDCLVLFYDSRKTSRWVERAGLVELEGGKVEIVRAVTNPKNKVAIQKAYNKALQDLLLSRQ